MGRFGDGAMLGRDGTTLFESPEEFGMEWQVQAEEASLFHFLAAPQHPHEVCRFPTASAERRLRGTSRAAEVACANVGADKEDCIFDVLSSGEIAMAEVYA